jgi:hypothetical protein
MWYFCPSRALATIHVYHGHKKQEGITVSMICIGAPYSAPRRWRKYVSLPGTTVAVRYFINISGSAIRVFVVYLQPSAASKSPITPPPTLPILYHAKVRRNNNTTHGSDHPQLDETARIPLLRKLNAVAILIVSGNRISNFSLCSRPRDQLTALVAPMSEMRCVSEYVAVSIDVA